MSFHALPQLDKRDIKENGRSVRTTVWYKPFPTADTRATCIATFSLMARDKVKRRVGQTHNNEHQPPTANDQMNKTEDGDDDIETKNATDVENPRKYQRQNAIYTSGIDEDYDVFDDDENGKAKENNQDEQSPKSPIDETLQPENNDFEGFLHRRNEENVDTHPLQPPPFFYEDENARVDPQQPPVSSYPTPRQNGAQTHLVAESLSLDDETLPPVDEGVGKFISDYRRQTPNLSTLPPHTPFELTKEDTNKPPGDDGKMTDDANPKKRPRVNSPVRYPTDRNENKDGGDDEVETDENKRDDDAEREPLPKKKKTTAMTLEKDYHEDIIYYLKYSRALEEEIKISFWGYHSSHVPGARELWPNCSEETIAKLKGSIYRALENYFDAGTGNVFQTENFFMTHKVLLRQYEYVDETRTLIDRVKASKCYYNDELKKRILEGLKAHNVAYFKFDLSYVYTDYVPGREICKIGIVKADKTIEYLGELPFSDCKLMFAANAQRFL